MSKETPEEREQDDLDREEMGERYYAPPIDRLPPVIPGANPGTKPKKVS